MARSAATMISGAMLISACSAQPSAQPSTRASGQSSNSPGAPGTATSSPAHPPSGGPGPSRSVDGAFLVRLIQGSSGITVAVDAAGAIHIATAATVQGHNSMYYGRCATRCDQTSSWQIVPLALESSVSRAPTIALTDDGRPRILYVSEGLADAGYTYLECDAGCDQPGSWRSARLSQVSPGTDVAARPRIPFALSADGAVFASDDGSTLSLSLCEQRCAAQDSWTQVRLAEPYFSAEAVSLSAGQDIQVVARHTVGDEEGLALFSCTRDCAKGASWATLDPLWLTLGLQRMALARTEAGGTRIIAYGDVRATSAVESVLVYLACDTGCETASRWKAPMGLPLPPDSAGVGFALALDRAGSPVVVTVAGGGAAVARCTGDCSDVGGQWAQVPAVSVAGLNASYPPTIPAGCLSASWGMLAGPALALDPNDGVVVGFTGHTKAFNGECGTGSAAITTDSFVISMP